ncbi:hypothetical protein WKY82_08410 [Gordonia malaquae]|uniref:hypothetical protein n=1 Tax=Gordonia malaquae TaxID=410332 RepID=UPI0030C7882F
MLDADGKVVKQIGRPWAFDAAGRPQKTWYEVDENGNLVQVVEPADNALYPILADPPGDTGGGLIAPTTGDNGADISAMPDTTGKQPGDTWTETRGGQDVKFTIPEGNGNQSVEMAYKGNDGQDATALIVSDGEGGYQAWSQSADGSGQYIDKDGPQAPGYSQWYRTGNDPAYNSPNQITDANYNFTEGTTYDLDNGSVTQAQLQPDNTYLNRTEYQTGEVDTAVNTPNGDGSYDQTQTSHLDADGENGWELREDGDRWNVHRGEDEFGRPLIESENPKTGESEIVFHDSDGKMHVQRFDDKGTVTLERVYDDSGQFKDYLYEPSDDGAIPRKTGEISYDRDGKPIGGEYEDGDNIVHINRDGSTSVSPKEEPGLLDDLGNAVMFVPRSLGNAMRTGGNPYAPNNQEELTLEAANSIGNLTYRPILRDLKVLSDVVHNSYYGPASNAVKNPTRPYTPPPGTEHSAGEIALAAADLALIALPVGRPITAIRRVTPEAISLSSVSRVARDIAVSPTPTKVLPLTRPVGRSSVQNQFVQNRIVDLKNQGATNFRVNQQQINYQGRRVGINRPDLQYNLNGKRFYEEFDLPSSSRGFPHKERILANDPSGVVVLWTVPGTSGTLGDIVKVVYGVADGGQGQSAAPEMLFWIVSKLLTGEGVANG